MVSEEKSNEKPLVIFDGDCGFCNGVVQFILKNEKKPEFLFTPRQSEIGQKIIHDFNIHADTVLVYEEQSVLIKSDAAIAIFKRLKFPYSLASKAAMVFPTGLRDFLYDVVAKNRLKLTFLTGKSCQLPDTVTRARFVSR